MEKGKITVLYAQVIACPKVQNQVFKKHLGKKAQSSWSREGNGEIGHKVRLTQEARGNSRGHVNPVKNFRLYHK